MSTRLADLTTEDVAAITSRPPTCVLVPVGSVEPHGPHLPLATDTVISEEAARRAADALRQAGIATYVAPPVSYGVTDYAHGFAGALSIPAPVLTAYLEAIAKGLLGEGFSHVCLVNNHLEPAHDAAVRAAIVALPQGRASVACPLTRRWARTLSEEFQRGDCHAGRYETSLVLAAEPATVRPAAKTLPAVPISLADGIRAGKSSFAEMGIDRAYTGAPREATAEEGDALYAKLTAMIVAEVQEGLSALAPTERIT
ncbi:creatininase family protein [Pendulispora rubella]|uniref:Creatininase family protein n=1 Tax=Pendulispora rubella TaxID=2741070 RepID=A0ABZ2L849_9BACT